MDISISAFLLLLFATILSFCIFQKINTQHTKISDAQQKFEAWKRQFAMSFSEQENTYRFKIFAQNVNKIQTHNQIQHRTYDLGLNHFAHLSQTEFIAIFLGNIKFDTSNIRIQNKNNTPMGFTNLTDVDWQILGKVSEIKNQGNCNAGYAFSTTSLIETSYMMQNQNVLLSEQQIIDCAVNYQSLGCNGGTRNGAIRFVQQKGLNSDKQYPYSGQKGQCKLQTGSYKPDFSLVESNGCNEIKQNLYMSPMTTAVNAKNWQLYSNGVFNNCPTTSEVNHQILLVGVTLTYWRIKNSWGTRWGEYGYIRLKLGNICGICERPAYGFVL